MAVMGFEELARFVFELGQVHARADTGQNNRGALAQLVLKVGVNDFLFAFLNQLDQRAQLFACCLQHGDAYVFPPLITGHRLNQHHLRLDGGNGFLLFKRAGNGLHGRTQGGEVGCGCQDGADR